MAKKQPPTQRLTCDGLDRRINVKNYGSVGAFSYVTPRDQHSPGHGGQRGRLTLAVVSLCAAVLALLTGNGLVWNRRSSWDGSHAASSVLHRIYSLESLFGSRRRERDRLIRKKLRRLSILLDGDIVFSDESDFSDNAGIPLAVIRASTEADVRRAVPVLAKLRRKEGVPFRVKSGGHHYAGFSSTTDGIVLSLSGLDDFAFDEGTGVATMGPGVTGQRIFDQVLIQSGYGGVVAECPGVAVGGFILGGGYGFLSRKYGLGLDNVVRFNVVLADGTLIEASENEGGEYSDLFWALRGAGSGNFGVVTQIEYQLYPSQDRQLFVSGTAKLSVMPSFLVEMGLKQAPGEMSLIIKGDASHDRTTDILVGWIDDDDDGLVRGESYVRDNVAPLLPLTVSDSLSYDRLSWSNMTREGDNFNGNYVRAWSGFLFAEQNTIEAWTDILTTMVDLCKGNPSLLVDIELWGGAISEKAPTDTAFYYRPALFNVGILVQWPIDRKHAHKHFTKQIKKIDAVAWPRIARYLRGAYTNYPQESLDEKKYARAYWGGNLERLRRVKAKYDPTAAFGHPQSVQLP